MNYDAIRNRRKRKEFIKCFLISEEKSVIEKYSVQLYDINSLSETYKLHQQLIHKIYKPKEYYEFILSKRGKTRLVILKVELYKKVCVIIF